jgi:hypothetical protein
VALDHTRFGVTEVGAHHHQRRARDHGEARPGVAAMSPETSPRQLRHPQAPQRSRVARALARWVFRFTPTSGSWLNAVGNFSRRSPAGASAAACSSPWSTFKPPSTEISTSTTPIPSASSRPSRPKASSPKSIACADSAVRFDTNLTRDSDQTKTAQAHQCVSGASSRFREAGTGGLDPLTPTSYQIVESFVLDRSRASAARRGTMQQNAVQFATFLIASRSLSFKGQTCVLIRRSQKRQSPAPSIGSLRHCDQTRI